MRRKMLHSKFILFFCYLSVTSSVAQNIVMFLTDDQDVVLGGMTPMRNVHNYISQEGVTFTNFYTASPICCPSRATILTGLYPHNHKTLGNSIEHGCNNVKWKYFERKTFATELQKAGYNTFYAGKYLNQYGTKETGGPQRVPPGWDEWHGLVGNSKYYNYTLSNNGIPTYSTDLYLTDIISDLSINFIESQTEVRPFLMVIAPPVPHQPATPARRHQGTYRNTTAMHTPSFNVKDMNKHWLIRMEPSPLPSTMMPELDEVYRTRWESLLAVDEMVGKVVETLETKNFLPNTYLVYTSDNGYHIGQFAQVYDKRQPYETDIKVPLVISGPGIPKNFTNYIPTLNIDLAPTLLSMAKVPVPETMDGQVIDVYSDIIMVENKNLLIEYYGEGSNTVDPVCPWKYDGQNLAQCYPQYACKCQDAKNNTYTCLRHFSRMRTFIDIKYCRFSDSEHFEEIYNLAEDPHEMTNIVDQMFPALKIFFRFILNALLKCKGADCYQPYKSFPPADVDFGSQTEPLPAAPYLQSPWQQDSPIKPVRVFQHLPKYGGQVKVDKVNR